MESTKPMETSLVNMVPLGEKPRPTKPGDEWVWERNLLSKRSLGMDDGVSCNAPS